MRRATTAAALLLAALALVVVAGCSEGEVGATPETVEGSLPTETTESCPSDVPACELEGDAATGEAIWASEGCGNCHTLAAAGSSGTVGPNLDDAKPSYDLAVTRVTLGTTGGMPAFADKLEPQQIADVAQYIVESTGG
jgi:mono/diheme cytochrome c family protein